MAVHAVDNAIVLLKQINACLEPAVILELSAHLLHAQALKIVKCARLCNDSALCIKVAAFSRKGALSTS